MAHGSPGRGAPALATVEAREAKDQAVLVAVLVRAHICTARIGPGKLPLRYRPEHHLSRVFDSVRLIINKREVMCIKPNLQNRHHIYEY